MEALTSAASVAAGCALASLAFVRYARQQMRSPKIPVRTTPKGFKCSVLGFGCWQLASKGEDDYWALEYTDEMAKDIVSSAIESGVTYFDTAEGYQDGASETQLGVAYKSVAGKTRADFVIGSKVAPNNCGGGKGGLEEHLDASLKRLGTDYIDLYMVHWPIDKNSMAHFAGGHTSFGESADESEVGPVPSTETAFTTLARLQKEGKIRHIGVSNFGVEQLKEAMATGASISINQVCYNLLFRAAEFDVIPFCEKNQIGVIGYSPLLQGILVPKYKSAEEVPAYRARSRHFDGKRDKSRHGEDGHERLLFETVAKLDAIAKEAGMPLGRLALAWPLANPAVCCVVAGATRKGHVTSNAVAANTKLSKDLLAKLNAASDELKQAMGSNMDMWQGNGNGRCR